MNGSLARVPCTIVTGFLGAGKTRIFGTERARRRWRDRLAPPQGRHRGRHQAPAHLIIPNDGQQTAMQDDDLFA
jgi:hypothetical protein